MPEVCVVIPAYQVTPYIAEALDSVLAQTFTDYEIVVVNDGCPDTEALERALQPYREKITYLKQQNGGPSAARNAGVQAANAPWIAFLDGDDSWHPRFLEYQLAFLREHPDLDAAYPDGIIIGDSPVAGKRLMDFSPSNGDVTVSKLVTRQCTVFTSLTIGREMLLRVGLFNPRFRHAEDLDLWLRVLKAGGKFGYYREPLIRYRRRAGSLSADGAKMALGAVEVLEEFEKRDDLTAEEREAVTRGKEGYRAEFHLCQGMQAFEDGQPEVAASNYRAANRYLRKPSLALKALLLCWFPNIAYFVAAWRKRRKRSQISNDINYLQH